MAHSVSDHLFDRLRAWGVHRIFGYPGDGINAIMGALARSVDAKMIGLRFPIHPFGAPRRPGGRPHDPPGDQEAGGAAEGLR